MENEFHINCVMHVVSGPFQLLIDIAYYYRYRKLYWFSNVLKSFKMFSSNYQLQNLQVTWLKMIRISIQRYSTVCPWFSLLQSSFPFFPIILPSTIVVLTKNTSRISEQVHLPCSKYSLLTIGVMCWRNLIRDLRLFCWFSFS